MSSVSMARRGAFLLAATSSLRVLETGSRNEGFVEQSLLSCVSSPALELLQNGTEGHHLLLLLLKPRLAEVLCEARVGPWCESCAAGGSRGDSKGSECLQGPQCGACSVALGVGMTVHLGCIKKIFKKRHERKLVFLPLPPGYCPSLGRGEGNTWYFKVCPFSVKQA